MAIFAASRGFVICGDTKPAGARQHFGALLLSDYRENKTVLHWQSRDGLR